MTNSVEKILNELGYEFTEEDYENAKKFDELGYCIVTKSGTFPSSLARSKNFPNSSATTIIPENPSSFTSCIADLNNSSTSVVPDVSDCMDALAVNNFS